MKWMFKSEVSCQLGLAQSLSMLGFRHPDGRYEFHLRNLDMTPGTKRPLMEVFVIYESDHNEDDFRGAVAIGEGHLEDLLALMTVVTSSRYELHRRVGIADWRTGVSLRRGAIFHNFGHPDYPKTILEHGFAEILFLLMHSKDHPQVRRALHWFSAGIAAQHPEDQFEYFWFVIETLAIAFKDIAQIPDRCAVCRSPLYCEKCNQSRLHRPYPKQAIEQLIGRIAPEAGLDGAVLFEKGNSLRNALQHGDDVANTEKSIQSTVGALVDQIGKVARFAVLNALGQTSTLPNADFQVISPSTLLHYRIHSSMIIARECDPGKPPQLDDFNTAGFSLEMIVDRQHRPDPPPAELQ